MNAQIVTANRLNDGIVVYFTKADTWSQWINDAHLCNTDAETQAALSLAQATVDNNEVLDAYLIDVIFEFPTIKPVLYRETIRSKGPSINVLPNVAIAANKAAPLAYVNGL